MNIIACGDVYAGYDPQNCGVNVYVGHDYLLTF